MRRALVVGALASLVACTVASSALSKRAPVSVFDRIEQKSGGRLGVALIDGGGRMIAGHRANERFAMCSTFKFTVVAMMLDRVGQGRVRLDDRLALEEADVTGHAPESRPALARGWLTLAEASGAAISLSDNGAANLLLRQVGGPSQLTRWLRARHDGITRLDRNEPTLNSNIPGDPRDTTSPAAIAGMARRLALGNVLQPAQRNWLNQWMDAASTGLGRIRAGLPVGWRGGDKTGTCGSENPAFNDVAVLHAPDGRAYTLAVYLDHPQVSGAAADAAIAEAARAALAPLMTHH